jgi:hypothetical protein
MTFHPVHCWPRQQSRSEVGLMLIRHCLANHKSCFVVTANSERRAIELRKEFPNAEFKIFDGGIRIVQK